MATGTVGSYLRVLWEFVASLGTLLWISLVEIFKFFLPVQKKDVSKEIVLITGAGSGIGRLMALRYVRNLFVQVCSSLRRYVAVERASGRQLFKNAIDRDIDLALRPAKFCEQLQLTSISLTIVNRKAGY